jgi:hypothetical protein
VIDFWTDRFGRIDEVGGTFVETQFYVFRLFPLLPRRSQLVLQEDRKGAQTIIPLPLQPRSVLAGYATVWLLLPVIILAGKDIFFDPGPDAAQAMHASLLSIALAALWALIFGWVGRLSAEQRAQRRVYARFAGHPFDVGLLVEADRHHDLAAKLRARVAERTAALGASGYREAVDPAATWASLAVSAEDGELRAAALTLARLESHLATGAARADLERVHARIWDRMRAAELARPAEPARDTHTGHWDYPIMGGLVVAATLGIAALSFHRRQPKPVLADVVVAPGDVGQPFSDGAPLQSGDAVIVLAHPPGPPTGPARAAEVVKQVSEAYVLVDYVPSGRRELVERTLLRQRVSGRAVSGARK